MKSILKSMDVIEVVQPRRSNPNHCIGVDLSVALASTAVVGWIEHNLHSTAAISIDQLIDLEPRYMQDHTKLESDRLIAATTSISIKGASCVYSAASQAMSLPATCHWLILPVCWIVTSTTPCHRLASTYTLPLHVWLVHQPTDYTGIQ
jgi:hypothetical protein